MSYTSINIVALEEAVYNHRSEEDNYSCAAVFFHAGGNDNERHAAFDYNMFNTAFFSQRTTIDSSDTFDGYGVQTLKARSEFDVPGIKNGVA